ncbi:hypothetical protein M0R45_037443 [Rubus argutus]|uniref:Endonuclease/exonuclease/phosphatase domain-containing protein n=1 Tax=Rubus argutus TaxID=59490 RepID=A0AAW1VZ36_RUBAR
MVDPICGAGGLALWWNSDVSVDFTFTSKNLLDTIITNKSDGKLFRATWVYGPPYRADKAEFWESASHLSTNDNCPWICVGDFNEILNCSEKDGGLPLSWNRPQFLRNFMNCNALLDVGYCGPKFTWENRRDNADLVRERLDRVLVNCHWLIDWPNTSVTHGSRIGSDHCPLIINPTPPPKKTGRAFKFEAMWVTEPECGQIIQQGWKEIINNNPMFTWNYNLFACRKALITWSKLKFPNNRRLIESISSDLALVQACCTIDRMKENELCMELSRLWDLEEIFWKQRSRLNWLLHGDRNTKFFHVTNNSTKDS